MRYTRVAVVVSLSLLGMSLAAPAQTVVVAPLVRVFSDPDAPGGPRVYVRAPLVRVLVGNPPPVVVVPPPPIEVVPAPVVPAPAPTAPTPAPLVPGPTPLVPVPTPPPGTPSPAAPLPPPGVAPAPGAAPAALTLQEFARTFRPAPGTYQVTLLHPRTGQPLTITFTLPAGTPQVYVGQRFLEFDYGSSRVTIVFPLGGGVRVRYR
jgi:hypothetical protein